MTILVKHAFTNAKTDGLDTTVARPSDWNANHVVTLAAGKVLGRDASAAGAMQELPIEVSAAGDVKFASSLGYFIGAKGSTLQRPGTVVTGMWRYNTSLSAFEGYNGAWLTFLTKNQVDAINEAATASLATAATMNIGAALSNTIATTGSVAVTAFDTIAAGAIRRLVAGAAFVLTHNATTLINFTGANITMAVGDVATYQSLGAGNWRMIGYERKSGAALYTEPSYAFSVHKNGTNQADTGATPVKLTWSTEDYDEDTAFGSSKYTCSAARVYNFKAHITWDTSGTGDNQFFVALYKNGAEVARTSETYFSTSFGDPSYKTVQLDKSLLCAINDYFEIFVWNRGAAPRTVLGATKDTWFSGS